MTEVSTGRKFYTFRQNNSGGSWVGPLYVIVEAYSAAEANGLAQLYTPVYFDGCSTGLDCHCCGDRWYEQYFDEGFDEPGLYESGVLTDTYYRDADIMIRYYDGSVVTVKGQQ